MSLRNSTKFCTKVRKVTKNKERTRALKKKKKLLANTIPFQIYKNCIQDAIDRLKKGKAKDSSGVRAEQLKNCSETTKEKSGRSSMKSHDAKKLAQDPNPGHLQTQSGRSCGQYLLNDRWFSHSVLKDVASEMAN